MRRGRILLAVLALVLSPAFAAEESGWYVGIEGASLSTSGIDNVLGTPFDPLIFVPSGPVVALDYGSGLAYGGVVGFQGGSSNYSLSYWMYDEDTDKTVEDLTNGFGVAWGNASEGDDFANRLDGEASLQSDVIDLTWSRPFTSNDRSEWNWSLGLRNWTLEHESTYTSDLDPVGGTFDDQLVMESEAQGIGLVAGIGARYNFSERIWGSSSLRFGYLTGDVDVTYAEDAFGDIILSGLDGVDRNFQQTDFDVRLNFNAVAGLDLWVGYQFKQFGNAYSEVSYPDDVQDGLVQVKTSDVNFAGISGGARYRF